MAQLLTKDARCTGVADNKLDDEMLCRLVGIGAIEVGSFFLPPADEEEVLGSIDVVVAAFRKYKIETALAPSIS
eukprot:CAMPEP_0179315466 /NCGR_PEP_ID=MMETSP0797-20121207/55079_1 /TAXON_ID=47934 /ORGANISM="Dinophysis acuminata, Strain DAEP01" /LENGTH=73 /DNA_ID=CAMNT_0021025997 /DNA_START=725 /DNA_END=943 /DNA_ORIENTATION=-